MEPAHDGTHHRIGPCAAGAFLDEFGQALDTSDRQLWDEVLNQGEAVHIALEFLLGCDSRLEDIAQSLNQ